jgi:hypothetical protein
VTATSVSHRPRTIPDVRLIDDAFSVATAGGHLSSNLDAVSKISRSLFLFSVDVEVHEAPPKAA